MKYIIIDNYAELKLVQSKMPELSETPLILISSCFNTEELESFKERTFCYVDDFIDKETTKTMAHSIHKMLWNWYKDENEQDISIIDGLSLGITVSPSMEILLNSIIKYEVGLSNLLKPKDEVFFVSNINTIFFEVIRNLNKKIGFNINSINSCGNENFMAYGRVKLDNGFRYRDLSPYFCVMLLNNFIYFFLKFIRCLYCFTRKSDRVLFFPCGKTGEFIEKKINNEPHYLLSWIFPFTSFKKELLGILFGRINCRSRFWFLTTSSHSNFRVKQLTARLDKNIRSTIKDIDSEVLISVMKRYITKYYPGIFSFFNNALSELTFLIPNLVIIGSDVSEQHLIVAQAAKLLGIKVALLPHGIDCWGYKEVRSGNERIIDYLFAYGEKHVMDNLAYEVKRDRITITSFPYFSKFLPLGFNKKRLYKKALVLAPDVYLSSEYKYRYFYDYLYQVAYMLEEMKIEIIGIKARGDYYFHQYNIKNDKLRIKNVDIPLYNGYSSFPDIARNVDCVIGNSSTAIIEAGLMGIDYYVFSMINSLNDFSVSKNVEKIMYLAHSIDELRENIINRRIYRNGFSVKTFVYLEGISTKKQLYNQFEDSISRVLKERSC